MAIARHRRAAASAFEKGLIKAEVISFGDLVALGSVPEARAKSKARLQGKDYVMQDGDVVEFCHG